MNLNELPDLRKSDRMYTTSSTLVKGKDAEGSVWKEHTEAISFSRTGAGFFLKHDCHPGQLLSLLVPLPRHLRAYDQERELYRVWGVVQHCQYLSESCSFQVGVAFVGRIEQDDYQLDPKKWYRIVGIAEDGLWKITETTRPFITRKFSRFPFRADVTISAVSDEDSPAAETESVTENISQRGSAVLSTLDVNIGDCVRFTLQQPQFSVLAVVRNRRSHHDNVNRIHLEFVTADFPIKEVPSHDVPEDVAQADDETNAPPSKQEAAEDINERQH
ncbi:MAG: PilZ domain-containing protein [Acidobacteria bacterium]|nr:PilZ domain-containing protein [Acidobacteriota bacterium]